MATARSATRTTAALCMIALLAACSSAEAGGDSRQEASGPHLIANGVVFDPVLHDVDDASVCAGEPSRTVLEEFDRAAWEEFRLDAGDAVMTCGHPDGAGWLHIADGHTDDYGEIADLVDADWEDVAWFAIGHALEEPTGVEQYDDDIANYLVLLEFIGDSGDVEQSWTAVVGVGLTSERIITSFPRDQR